MSEFKVGDKVRLVGGADEWTVISDAANSLYVWVSFSEKTANCSFKKDDLELISRAPTLVKHWPAIYKRVGPGGRESFTLSRDAFVSMEHASEDFGGSLVRLATEYPPILLPAKGE